MPKRVGKKWAISISAITDVEALESFHELSRKEGIIPALESSYTQAEAKKIAARDPRALILINLSGRGDKDLEHVRNHMEN